MQANKRSEHLSHLISIGRSTIEEENAKKIAPHNSPKIWLTIFIAEYNSR